MAGHGGEADRVARFPVYPVLKGKVALITGGAGGIGKATASAFVRAGAKVVISDIQGETGRATAAELSDLGGGAEAGGGEISFVRSDISDSQSVRSLIEHVVSAHGRLDVVVNNAAVMPDGKALADADEDYWVKLLSVNVTGTALVTKYALRQMRSQFDDQQRQSAGNSSDGKGADFGSAGSIVITASVNSYKQVPLMPAYTTSKHAVLGLMRHAAMEGGEFGVRVNAVAPGGVHTDFAVGSLKAMGTTEEEFAGRTTYAGRFARDHEIAQGILFLASDAASYITGAVLPIDGGYLIK